MNNKAEQYSLLTKQIAALVEGETNVIGVLANVSAAMKAAFPDTFFWVGFYVVSENELQLGPFQGPVACYHIQKGRGVCGTSWQNARSIVVDDVEKFPGHIACSSLSRSEIVVPVFKNGTQDVAAVIDIDSRSLASFDETDRIWLEKIAAILSRLL